MKISPEAREAAANLEAPGGQEYWLVNALDSHPTIQAMQILINATLDRAAGVANAEFEYAATQDGEDQIFGAQAASLRICGAILALKEVK